MRADGRRPLDPRQIDQVDAVVTDTDQRGARIQLCSPAVIARLKASKLVAGERVKVKLDSTDPLGRSVRFSLLS